MKEYKLSSLFEKKISKLKGQELINLLNKIDEICFTKDTNHYKNLKHNLKKYKRAHVNNSFVILFFDENNLIYFVDYEHHDKIYKINKKEIKKYENIIFQ